MALPAMHALANAGDLEIRGAPWITDVYRDVSARISPLGTVARGTDAAVLFPPSFRAAWECRRAARRIGTPTDFRSWLLTDAVASDGHTASVYARLVGALGLAVDDAPAWPRRATDPTVDLPDGHVGINPVSRAGRVRQWPHFRRLAAQIQRPVVVYAGPGEREQAKHAMGDGFTIVDGLPLPAFAGALRRCVAFVSGDGGAAHFARAVGTPTLVVYGSTHPQRTGPAGSHAVGPATVACAPCYKTRCPTEVECLDLSVAKVHHALEKLVGG